MRSLAPLLVMILGSAPALAQDDEPPKKRERHPDEAATALLEEAIAKIDEADGLAPEKRAAVYEAGLALLDKVVAEHEDAAVYGMALFNRGVFLCEFLERPEAAIPAFERVIASDVDDQDDTGMLMDPFRNYRYNAWRMISLCEERCGREGKAIVASLAAEGAYISDCGTWAEAIAERVQKRNLELCRKIGGESVTGEQLTGLAAPNAEGLLLGLARSLAAEGAGEKAAPVAAVLERDFPESPEAAEAKKIGER